MMTLLYSRRRSGVLVPWYRAGGAPQPVAAYQPKGAASLAASYVNLANPGTYNAAPGVAPTWATGVGWTFDGVTQYLVTGVVPASGYSMLVQYTGATFESGDTLCGEFVANAAFLIQYVTAGTNKFRYYSGGSLDGSAFATAGNIGIAGQTAYLNGVAEAGSIPAWSAATIYDIYIGAVNNAGTGAPGVIAASVVALAIYSTTLTGPQVAAVASAMASL